jgi:hypothetical protein
MTFAYGTPEFTLATGAFLVAATVFLADVLEQIGKTADVKDDPRLADILNLIRAGFKVFGAIVVFWVAMRTFGYDEGQCTFWSVAIAAGLVLVTIVTGQVLKRVRKLKRAAVIAARKTELAALDDTPMQNEDDGDTQRIGPKQSGIGAVTVGLVASLLLTNAVLAGLVFKTGQRSTR